MIHTLLALGYVKLVNRIHVFLDNGEQEKEERTARVQAFVKATPTLDTPDLEKEITAWMIQEPQREHIARQMQEAGKYFARRIETPAKFLAYAKNQNHHTPVDVSTAMATLKSQFERTTAQTQLDYSRYEPFILTGFAQGIRSRFPDRPINIRQQLQALGVVEKDIKQAEELATRYETDMIELVQDSLSDLVMKNMRLSDGSRVVIKFGSRVHDFYEEQKSLEMLSLFPETRVLRAPLADKQPKQTDYGILVIKQFPHYPFEKADLQLYKQLRNPTLIQAAPIIDKFEGSRAEKKRKAADIFNNALEQAYQLAALQPEFRFAPVTARMRFWDELAIRLGTPTAETRQYKNTIANLETPYTEIITELREQELQTLGQSKVITDTDRRPFEFFNTPIRNGVDAGGMRKADIAYAASSQGITEMKAYFELYQHCMHRIISHQQEQLRRQEQKWTQNPTLRKAFVEHGLNHDDIGYMDVENMIYRSLALGVANFTNHATRYVRIGQPEKAEESEVIARKYLLSLQQVREQRKKRKIYT